MGILRPLLPPFYGHQQELAAGNLKTRESPKIYELRAFAPDLPVQADSGIPWMNFRSSFSIIYLGVID